MNKFLKWGLSVVAILSMVNFVLFLDNKSIFMSRVNSLAGLNDWQWRAAMNGDRVYPGQPYPELPGPRKEVNPQSGCEMNLSVTVTTTYEKTVKNEMTKTVAIELEGETVLTVKGNYKYSTTSGSAYANSKSKRSTMGFTFKNIDYVYDIFCDSPNLTYECTEHNGWNDGFDRFLKENVYYVAQKYGGSISFE